MALGHAFFVLAALCATLSSAYYDHGDATIPKTTYYPPTIPHHMSPTDYELWTKPRPSMITGIAPSMEIMGHGLSALRYSIHFQGQAAHGHQQQHGIFKRGVFASDPPLSTCQSCSNGTPIRPSTTSNATGFTSTPCSTIPYSVSWQFG
jgi:hypothetical protein